MSQAVVALVTGIVSGLISAILVFIGVKWWNRAIVPWYEERVYKDVKISGVWETSYEDNNTIVHEVATVEQNAHRVWGEITCEGEEYLFEGEFRNLILTARYWEKSRNTLDRGTFTLMLKGHSNTLRGFYAWYLGEESNVKSGWYEWNRKQ